MSIEMKTCSQCNTDKPLSDFHLNRSAVDGYYDNCKVCMKKQAKEQKQEQKEESIFIQYKTCRDCQERKPVSDFYKEKQKKDGYNIRCKKCVALLRKRLIKKYEKNRPDIRSKHCGKCNQEKDIKDFYKDRATKDGYQLYCKKCSRKMIKKWQQANPEHASKLSLRWYRKNSKHAIAVRVKWGKKNADKARAATLRAMKKHARYDTYAKQLTPDEKPKQDAKGYLSVKCTYCGKYFYPTVGEVQTRVWGLTHVAKGENRLYCSDNCKAACPVFNQRGWPKGFKPATSREAQPVLRQVVLERDSYTCQICFKSIPDIELHCHHILGYKQHRAYAEDPDNCVSLCKKCHKKVHKLPGCNYKDLRCKEPPVDTRN